MSVDLTIRLSCDYCGTDHEDLRVYPNHGYVPNDILCKACFIGRDPENTFEDFELAQKGDRRDD